MLKTPVAEIHGERFDAVIDIEAERKKSTSVYLRPVKVVLTIRLKSIKDHLGVDKPRVLKPGKADLLKSKV